MSCVSAIGPWTGCASSVWSAKAGRLCARGIHESSARLLGEALGLWRGPALVDFAYEAFAHAEAARLDEIRVGALEDKIEAELALGRHGEVIGELGERPPATTGCENGSGRSGCWPCTARAAKPRPCAAYQELRAHLGDELGITPSPELVALEEAIVLQKPELDWQPPERVTSSAVHDLPSGTVTFLCFY